MSTTAEELLVAIRSDGVSQTQEDLEGVEQTMDETAQSAGESADELDGFSTEFQGAMTAAVSALAVGAAGLLSQVPVLGETMSGLFAIVQALAFQMDSVLRPILSPIGNAFFGLADKIFQADGALGKFIGIATSVVSALAVLAGVVLGVVKVAAAFAGTFATIVAVVKGVIAVVTSLGFIIAALPVAIGVAIAALLGLAFIFRDEIGAAIGTALTAIGNFVDKAVQWFLNLTSDLADWASDLAKKAFNWGKNVVQGIINGIKSALSKLRSTLNDIGGTIESTIGIDVSDFGGGVGGGGGGGSGPLGGLFGGGGGGISLDGRQLSESTGRYRADPSRRRGI